MVTVTELNRAANITANAIDAESVSADTLEATGSITDPEGNTVTSLSDPVRVTEEASTFTESDVKVTTTNTIAGAATVSRPDDNTTNTNTSFGFGTTFSPNRDLNGIEVTVSGNTPPVSEIYIVDANENFIARKQQTIEGGDKISFNAALTKNTTYVVGVYDGGNTYDVGEYDNASYPYTSSSIDITAGSYNSHPNDGSSINTTVTGRAFAIKDIKPAEPVPRVELSGSNTSGSALIEWNSAVPDDIKSYDLATWQRTLDGETVTIDVEDANNNVLFSDIGQNFDISTVDTAKEVKLRVNLSRNNTANNPTVDYLARRFTR